MADTPSMAQAAPVRKYSRYVKTRRAQTLDQQATEPAAAPAPMSSSAPKMDTIQRSMSRYRKSRPRAPTVAQKESVPETPILGSYELKKYEDAEAAMIIEGRSRDDSQPSLYNPYSEQNTAGPEQRSNSNHMSNRSSGQRASLIKRMSDQPVRKCFDSKVSPPMIELKQETDKEAEELLEKSKREDLARLEATLDKAASSQPLRGRTESQSTWDRLKRKMSRPREEKASPPTSAVTAERKISAAQDALSRPRGASERIIAGGNVRVDAPRAETARERNVDVRFNTQRQRFAIQKTTTAGDVIIMAVQIFNTHFKADAAVLKESYHSDALRLERRLRFYELVTPVMNSWDRDTQNELVLEASDSPRHDMDLLAGGAPQEQPKPTSVHVYHASHSKGRWYKHWITLQTSGQIIMSSSKPEPGRNAKAEKLAHMLDADIYMLTTDQQKGFKQKRKFCSVIKSQTPQTRFEESPDKFVHFFSTGNAQCHQEWMDACQSWRSWHLNHGKKDDTPSAAMNVPHSKAYNNGVYGQIDYAKNPSLLHQGSYKQLALNTSFAETRYDSDNARKDSQDFFEEQYDSDYRSPISPHNQSRQIPFHLRHGSQGPTTISAASVPQEPFHQGGLLGRSYSQRQKVMQENAPRVLGNADFMTGAFTGGLLAHTANGPLGHTNGGGLINGAGARSNSITQRNDGGGAGYTSRPSTSHNNSARNTPKTFAADVLRRPSFAGSRPGTAGSGMDRNGSLSNNIPPVPDIPMLPPGVQPLVDMTPEFKEAPQWRSEGKGRGVRVPQGVPLVDAAGSRWDKEGKEYHPEEFRRTNTLKGGYR